MYGKDEFDSNLRIVTLIISSCDENDGHNTNH